MWITGSAALIVSSLVLEIHQPALDFKFGNLAFLLVCLLIIRARLLNMREAMRPGVYDFFMFCYLAWAAYSISFSPVPRETAVQVTFAAVLWITALCLKQEPIYRTLHILYVAGVCVAISSLAILVLAPDIAVQPHSSTGEPELRGVFEHQLRLGMYMGTGAGLLVVAAINGHLAVVRRNVPAPLFWLGALAILLALQLSQARSPIAALVVTLVLCCSLAAPQRIIRVGAIAAIVGAILAIQFYPDQLQRLFFTTESDLTFSGRIRIWQEAWAAADRQPWIGHGFASFAAPAFDSLWVHYRPPSAHNSLLQAYFETGYVGAFLLLALVAAIFARGIYLSVRYRIISYTLVMCVYGIFCSFMSVIYAGKPSIFMALILLVAAQERVAAGRPYPQDHQGCKRRRTSNSVPFPTVAEPVGEGTLR
ncbi:O-antigen ligase family protein [Rhizobium sullae]|uniref:O-antigen ligase n=1 Tax=Rhizobium sullae TaxID=50338 RepID=A0A4R3PRK1_RHISU|nr:O-antigen ligase family protein [Rhizobium sullae]TCU06817.1 O-antigen ligase [Rhizobium sullae]